MFQGRLFYYQQLSLVLTIIDNFMSSLSTPAQLRLFLGAINVFRLLPPHLVQDDGDPARQLLDPDIVDWVVETSAVAQLTPAPTDTGESEN